MRVKERNKNLLIVENKSINLVGILGCTSIFAALIYKIIQLIEEKDLSIILLAFFLVLTLFLLFGLAIALSVEFFSIDKASQKITIVSQMLSIKRVTEIAWTDIKNIEVVKTNTDADDIGSVRYEMCACLISGKKIELGRSTSEKKSQDMAKQVRTFMNF